MLLTVSTVLSLSACGGKKEELPEDLDNTDNAVTDEYVDEAVAEEADDGIDESDPMNFKSIFMELKGSAAKDLAVSGKIIINRKTRKAAIIESEAVDSFCVSGTKLFYTDRYDSPEESYYTKIFEYDISTQESRELYNYNATVNAISAYEGKLYFYAENDGFYCIDGKKEKHVEYKQSIYYPEMIAADSDCIYFIDADSGDEDYVTLMRYSFDTGKFTKISDKVDASVGEYSINGDKIYYVTNRRSEYDKAESVKYGLYGVMQCGLDGSGKKLIGKYVSNPYEAVYLGKNEFLYSEYLSEPKGYSGRHDYPEIDESQIANYVMDLKTGKSTRLNSEVSFYDLSGTFLYTSDGIYGYAYENDKLEIYRINADGKAEKVDECEIDYDKSLKGDKAYYSINEAAYCDGLICYLISYYNIGRMEFRISDT